MAENKNDYTGFCAKLTNFHGKTLYSGHVCDIMDEMDGLWKLYLLRSKRRTKYSESRMPVYKNMRRK